MFELSVAAKYLIPRLKYLSYSIISTISIFVIAVVVWLVIVFFSATEGLEKRWTERLISITAPVRILPTQKYYNSYYYLIDSVSSKSNYTLKSLQEKEEAMVTDPYDVNFDAALPYDFPKPYLNKEGKLVDLVKLAEKAAVNVPYVPNISCSPFESAFANVRIRTTRKNQLIQGEVTQQLITQAAYVTNFDVKKMSFKNTLLPLKAPDLENMLVSFDEAVSGISQGDAQSTALKKELKAFFERIKVKELITPQGGWSLPLHFLPEVVQFDVRVLSIHDRLYEIHLVNQKTPLEPNWIEGVLKKEQDVYTFIPKNKSERIRVDVKRVPLRVPGGITLRSTLQETKGPLLSTSGIEFFVMFSLQGHTLQGVTEKGVLEINSFVENPVTNGDKDVGLWLEAGKSSWVFSPNFLLGEPILLPKSFRENGVLIGDVGNLSYFSYGASSMQEQRLPVFVAGFYDPGIIPIGGKLILARNEVVSLIYSAGQTNDTLLPTGLNVNFANVKLAKVVRDDIEKNFQAYGIQGYFTVQSYDQYDFSKDIFQQLKSERNLFSLIALIIIVVACSNIISMLIILVHDKRKEVAILRALGASKKSIGFIFGFCGLCLGAVGGIIGAILAYYTVKNINQLLAFLGKLQGFDVLNAAFYGASIPTDVSAYAVIFVICITAIASLLAGLIAALKACRENTSDALRTE